MLRAILVVVAVCGGCVFGGIVVARRSQRSRGFDTGAILGSPATLLLGLQCAHLLGGWGEAALGITAGVPLGVFIGSFFGVVVAGYVTGFIGQMFRAFFQRT